MATHEAAHFVTAVSRGVGIHKVWIKAKRGSGLSIRTKGADGHVAVWANDYDNDAFVSYAGHAWEEIHGDIGFARVDFEYAQRNNQPEELEKARKLIQEQEQLISQVAAAMIELRDSRGWLKGKKLQDLCSWVQFQQRKGARDKLLVSSCEEIKHYRAPFIFDKTNSPPVRLPYSHGCCLPPVAFITLSRTFRRTTAMS